MPWPLVLLSESEWKRRRNDYTLAPGHCAYAPWVMVPDQHGEDDWRKKELGSRYLSLPDHPERPRRAPILICLPDTTSTPNIWCPDCMAWNSEKGSHGSGWDVMGILPMITIVPSINYPGRFHGYVRDGFVTDDVEGRKFNPCGSPVPSKPPSEDDASKAPTGSYPTIPGVSPSGLHKRPPIPPGA